LEGIEFEMDHLKNLKTDRVLNEQILKHGEYGSILDIQERKKQAGTMMVA
jgi:hypothetical protein